MSNAIKDISFASIRKERFRIDEDDDRIIELNTSDLGIITRLEESYPKLNELDAKVKDVITGTDADDVDLNVTSFGPLLKEIDSDMRSIVDYIFDSDVSAKCAPFGNMFDLINGQCRYEHVISTLLKLYDAKLESEAKKTKNRMNTHTSKYTK